MSIQVSIQANNGAELQALIRSMLCEQAVAPAKALEGEILEPTKPRTTKPKKTEPVTIEAKATEVVEQKDADTTPAAVPDIDALRAALKSLGGKHGTDAVFELLGKFDAKSASGVDEGKRAAVIAEANKLVEG